MRGQRQGEQSTQRVQPVQGKCNKEKIKKKQDIFIPVYELDEDNQLTNAIYSDQTGDFPYISCRGNRSIMVIHHVDSNSFWVEPIRNQKEGALIAAQTIILEQMRQQGIVPKHQILDNQCKGLMNIAIELSQQNWQLDLHKKTAYKLVPPEDHQRHLCKMLI